MLNFGFSMYPEKYPLETSIDYIDLMVSYGARRLFLSLLQIKDNTENNYELYEKVIKYATDKGLIVVADISPSFISANGWQDDLIQKSFDFGLNGIRLDESLSVEEIVELSHNPYGIKIELNSSTEKNLIVELIEKGVNKEQLLACHNFYPHRYTGLSKTHFLEMSTFYKNLGIESSVFISSNTATEGPWPVSEGLPTLEELRDLPISIQIDALKSTGLFDNVIISNQFVHESELKEIRNHVNSDFIVFKFISEVVTEIEKQILEFEHEYRGDISEFVIRSTKPRVKFSDSLIPPRENNIEVFERGAITIDNDNYSRYKGELQIVLKSYKDNPKVNFSGRIIDEYLILLDYIKPWQKFKLIPINLKS